MSFATQQPCLVPGKIYSFCLPLLTGSGCAGAPSAADCLGLPAGGLGIWVVGSTPLSERVFDINSVEGETTRCKLSI